MSKGKRILLAAPLCALLSFATAASPARALDFEVTITNLTAGQVFTPIVMATHRPGHLLFSLGEPASVELEALAEGGETGPLAALLEGSPLVSEVVDTGAPLPPGESVTVVISADRGARRLSFAGMLVPTNDGFVAAQNVPLHPGQTVVLHLPGYDAGTEANDELCANVPGPPPVCQGEGFNPSRDGAEGYVHVHRGIHGIGDLDAAAHDWRNPVVQVIIRRVS